MADKIKSFFQKKKLDSKFSRAGKGHKLTESTSSSASAGTQKPENVKRIEPTEEAKIAGQAALARLEAKKTDITKFNTSYAAIQARVRKELEMEKKAKEQEKETLGSEVKKESKESTPTPIEDENNPLLAVTGVYFRCPIISDEVLTRDEWRKKIKEFLYDQLQQEEPGLTACLIIHNCNLGKEKIEICIETLGKYLDNILKNPDIEKYRKIRMSNRIFQEKVLSMEGTLEFLKAAGFRQQKLSHEDKEEDFLVWNPEESSLETLTILSEALRSAEPIPLELDRNTQVLGPCQANERNELPASFFTMSLEELKKEQQLRTEAVERSQMLRTKAMREKDEQRELRRYKFALIRIKLSDDLILQGTFSVHEKFSNVVEFVKEYLKTENQSFSLVSPTGQQYTTEECLEKTLLDLKLIPATLLILTHHASGDEKTDPSTGEC